MTLTIPTDTETVLCPDHHRHGATGTCYHHHKCRCTACCAGVSERETRRVKLHAYGRYVSPWVDAAPVRAHVEMLRSSGMGYKTIAKRAGIGPTGVRTLIYGREDYTPTGHGPRHGEVLQRVGREKAAKILAVTPDLENLPATAPVPAKGTSRRIEALIAHGWSQHAIALRLGMYPGNLGALLKRAHKRPRSNWKPTVHASTAIAIAALYDVMSNEQPPRSTPAERATYERTRRYALEHGWPLPMDWESVDNDFDRTLAVKRSAA